ncbi:hypothetical protein DSM104443_02814 [Usitatibacter rugosus]|uniref:Glucose/Sorbosone dehydrogenase domain-containing protein n=1 Tax=Usitatibacter rugosus TaxID=2732067 RepID=A0A6M4GXJ2_9PROT|nr:PQQ-dependent sugar dehydrogenase [Usitatibacter rugosus]QJR11732.1 hypothetical protein DSM104443_02814 [Usitatibacter rugosus]
MKTSARLGFAALLLFATGLTAAAPLVTPRLVAEGLTQPVAIAHPGDGTGRLFIVEKVGRIQILQNGAVLPTPFLDISPRVSTSGERGLLGLAFDPNYENNGRFFVYYARIEDGALRVSSFTNRPGVPNQADPDSEQSLLTIAHPGADNHNGGQLAFGPDGFLYIGTGDGGGSGDPNNNAQSDGSLLGKILRLDVTRAQASPEIWAKGLRNPWRFSFDRGTGDLYIGDVGQNRFEEVNYAAAGTGNGRNYGWRVIEGNACFNPPTSCFLAGATGPVLTYGHDMGQSITGGYVYRGFKSRDLYGYYIYGDFVSNRIWAARQTQGGWVTEQIIGPGAGPDGISSFGEDEAGELYVASYNTGRLYALEGSATARFQQGTISGLWWNPAESGWGVQFTHRGDVVFATIYNYGPDGQPKWYIASDCHRVPASAAVPLQCSGDLYEVQGPRYFGVPFDPSAVHSTAVGRINVKAFDTEHVQLVFNVGSITRDVALQRNVFRDRAVALQTDYTDLYYNSAEPGWGVTISNQGDVFFVAWYVYDETGHPQWFIASSCNVTGNGCAGTLYKVTGPPLASNFDTSQVVSTPVGNITLAFDNANDATLSYTVNGVSGTKRISRFEF